MIGTTLSHYRIVEALGSGGMGEVYAAEDTKLHRKVALKVLPQAMAADPERRQRFEREAQAVAALNHPNIVTIYSVEEASGVHFITMELVEGKTLSDITPKDGLPLDSLLKLAVPLADAVSAAHQRGITHRDLKPGNIMLGNDGRLKVLDFGLAKLKAETGGDASITTLPTEQLTGEGRIIGTVAYMSPEQAEGKTADHRSDVFSLGVVLYQMATGERPFKGGTSVSLISSIIKDTPTSVSQLNPAMPRELGRIVRRSLAKDPTRRYQTATDLRNELEELKQEVDSGEVLADGAVRTEAALGPRRRWLVAAGVLTVLAAVGGSLLLRPAGGPDGVPTALMEATFTQLTSQSGLELFPSMSPDGGWIVYTGDAAGNPDVYLQSVGGQVPINLTVDSTAADTQPTFSPDGERIAFRSARRGGGLFVMGRTGESPRRLTDMGFNPVWSPDGVKVLFATENVGLSPYGRGALSQLWAVTVATGDRERITEGDAVQPHWSPHGHRIAYWAIHPVSAQRDIWTMPATGGDPVPVTDDAAVDWNPVWSPDGRYLYFCSDRGGSINLWRVPINEQSGEVLGPLEPLTTPSPRMAHLSISGDGRRIAYVSGAPASNIHVTAFDPTREAFEGNSTAVTTGSRAWSSPDPSPDGEWVTFYSGPPQEDIFVIRSDGTGLRQLTNDPANDRTPRWSPDGEQIAFYSNRGGSYDIWTIDPDGSQLRQLTTTEEHTIYPVWSPDGSRMAVTHGPTIGETVSIFEPGRSWEEQTPQVLRPVAEAGAPLAAWSWSPDGQWLAGQSGAMASTGGISTYSLESREYERLTDFGSQPAWLSDGRRLLFTAEGKLHLVDRQSKHSHEVLSVLPDRAGSPKITPDDRQVYFARGTSDADIWMLTLPPSP